MAAVHTYEPHTWGPPEADQLIAVDGGWHTPNLDGPAPKQYKSDPVS
jgi:hypothetical protein